MSAISTTTSLNLLTPGITFDTATTSLATKCIEMAEAWTKSALSKRYDISASPFTVCTTTSQLTNLIDEMAVGFLYKFMSRGAKESLTRGQSHIDSAKSAIMEIASYKSNLMNADGSGAVSDSSQNWQVLHSASSYHTTFDEDDQLEWTVDSDKLEDIANGRI